MYRVQCIPYDVRRTYNIVHITCYSICCNRFLMYWVCIVYILSCIVNIYLVVRSVYTCVRVHVYARVLYTYAFMPIYVRMSVCVCPRACMLLHLHTRTCEYIQYTSYNVHIEICRRICCYILYTVHCTVYNVHCTIYSVH